jgi:serine/threonine protein phosphatase PrpC
VLANSFEFATLIRACQGAGQDRVAVSHHEAGLVVVVADGAGGVAGGAAAAEAIIDDGKVWLPEDVAAPDVIRNLDHRLGSTTGGQATAVLLSLRKAGIVGASVGDSSAWIVRHGSIEDLTSGQNRKPLVGSGASVPVAFSAGPLRGGTLVVGSDGLFKYARPSDIARVVAQSSLETAASDLVALVTLRSGDLPDDVAVVLCREADSPGG